MFILFFLCLFVVLIVLITQRTRKIDLPLGRTPTYRRRLSVMNKSEAALYLELKRQLPENYHIFPNMRIADFIDAEHGEGFYNRRNKILPKHIDFLICDFHFKPLFAIELNGSSHLRPDRVERDKLVKAICEQAALPLEFIDVGANFETSVELVKSHLIKRV